MSSESTGHSDIFEEEADHDNIALMLEHFSGDPGTFEALKDACRLDLTDKEMLQHTHQRVGKATVSDRNTDDDWKQFKIEQGWSSDEQDE